MRSGLTISKKNQVSPIHIRTNAHFQTLQWVKTGRHTCLEYHTTAHVCAIVVLLLFYTIVVSTIEEIPQEL